MKTATNSKKRSKMDSPWEPDTTKVAKDKKRSKENSSRETDTKTAGRGKTAAWKSSVKDSAEDSETGGGGSHSGKSSYIKRTGISDPMKRMSSITRRLHWYGIRQRSLRFLRIDLFFFCLSCVGWCAQLEYIRLGRISFTDRRSLTAASKPDLICYTVTSSSGETLLSESILEPFLIICAVVGCLLALQLLGQFFSYFREDKKIRAILSPINEIALKADELSRLSFTEDKYQEIEQAIENIQPGQAGENTPLSFMDSDLSGIEAAMNNLLLRMRDTYRQQARFVNDASHELRTPIAVILGYANMLDRWGKTDPRILEEGIGAIRNEADHMNHLVEQLLFLARGDSGKTTLSLEKLSICDLMREIYEESFMIDENHHYRLQVPEYSVETEADPGLLKQAVRILIDNASKYTPAGEEIILSAGRTDESEPYLQVQDLGAGIAQSEIPHVFERFYRSDEVRSTAGTGLGLSIAKWIVDKHGGHFEILSRQDLGTRIRIVLRK